MQNLAVVFPGQGSQFPGMLDAWLSVDSYVGTLIEQGSDCLGYDMGKLIRGEMNDQLNLTRYTQPALLLTSFAIWSVLNARTNCQVKLMAGHSLGEYTALLCAGTLSFEQALKLVAKRGEFMQSCVAEGEGGMAVAIGLENATVDIICSDMQTHQQRISPANYNAIGQVVVAGESNAINDFIDKAKSAGAKMAKRLPVSVPSHCMMMAPAADALHAYLESINLIAPLVTVLNNVDSKPHHGATHMREKLCQQLIAPVQWVNIINTFSDMGVTDVLEIGPGRVLTGLCKRINQSMQGWTLDSPDKLESIIALIEKGGEND